MVRKWMLNCIAALACLWLVYVLLHWTQLRVWAKLHQPIMMKFQYVMHSFNTSDVFHHSSSIEGSKSVLMPDSIQPVKLKPYAANAPKCNLKNLGKITTPVRIEDLTKELKSRAAPLHQGIWQPTNCTPASRLAVLIPYRNRPDNLALVTNHLNFFLQQQFAAYGIFVFEQVDKRLFNRAKLFNVGVKLLTKMYPEFDCYFFHDADKLPINTQHIYTCGNRPRHMIALMQTGKAKKFIRGKLYNFFFGGVTSMRRSVYERVNGMSNNYWGWGREDDDMSARLRLRGIIPQYTTDGNAKYINIAHKHDIIVNKNPWPHFNFVRNAMKNDGLNSATYSLISVTQYDTHTHFKVKL